MQNNSDITGVHEEAHGEKRPQSEFTLTGRSLDLGAATQFEMGSVTRLTIDVRWGEVTFIARRNKRTDQDADMIRRHKGEIVNYELEHVF